MDIGQEKIPILRYNRLKDRHITYINNHNDLVWKRG